MILLFGILLILTDFFLEPALNAYQVRRARRGRVSSRNITGSTHSRLEWRATSVLQLQRLAHSAIGSGTWFNTADETPTTLPYEKLAVLNINNRKCPFYEPLEKVSDMSDDSKVRPKAKKIDTSMTDSTLSKVMGSSVLPLEPVPKPWSWRFGRVRTGMSDATLAGEETPKSAEMAKKGWV